ncbi:short-chain collagen C4-like [Crassostrea angulata]|uniref:short-chain collagen C4-like n=1 Tax=Magallana angulata TaxID=2784310 RepID=UPI0022B1C175|nr:short-chain collagen C4-like [Crassostrea angulata]
MIAVFFVMLAISLAGAETNTETCKDMLQGYLTGQLSSGLGTYQVEVLRREFKSFTEHVEESMRVFKETVKSDKQKMRDAQNSSVVYTRWGKKTCPPDAETILSGFTGGSWFDHKGAAVDPLCLPRDPEWGLYTDGTDGDKAYVYGAEYETATSPGNLRSFHQHDVPCAVCLQRNRSVVKMFPARKSCYKGWKLEYRGNLMTGYHDHSAGTMYNCVDEHPDTLHGGLANKNGKLFYSVEARCGSLKCPPYVEGREIVCVVCSKE